MQRIALPSRLVGVGLYTPAEASLYTGIPATDIRRWLFGPHTVFNIPDSGTPSLPI
jgi:hypothetical protein